MIVPLYQPQGSSSHLLAKAYGDSVGEKATHTGTLDPMAEGVLIVLTGEDRYQKGTLSDGRKHYQFEILWGIRTDSIDLLGLIKSFPENNLTDFNQIKGKVTNYLQIALNDFIGQYRQKMPDFSAKRVEGQSAFDLAKEGKEVVATFTDVELFSARVLGHFSLDSEEVFENLEQKISKVNGNFRQKEIINTWEIYLSQLNNNFFVSSVEIETSKRFYVRSLVRDLSEKLRIPATTLSIVRTQNGQYSIADCKVFKP